MSSSDDVPQPDPSEATWRATAPAPLVAAAGMALVQGLLVVLGGVTELLSIDADRLALGLSTAVFFLLYGTALLVCAWGLYRVRPWSRGPVLVVQLIWLGLAWNVREAWLLSVALVVSAAIVLVGLLHPRSMAAVEAARDDAGA